MNEKISRLMDGELEQAELDAVCAGLEGSDAMVTWTCYHVIGDALRGSGGLPAGLHARLVERLEAEPTVLSPQRRASPSVATWAWAAAATVAAITVVGWTAVSVVGDMPAFAKAREASAVSAAHVRPSNVPADYLLAHQEYSPAAAIQGVGPYLRAVATTTAGDRP